MIKPIIFAHARSGSSSLAEIIHATGKADIVQEPFRMAPKRNWTPQQVHNSMAEIISRWGIKTLYSHLTPDFYREMFTTYDNPVIHLKRRDIFATAISWLYASITGKWSSEQYSDIEHGKVYIRPESFRAVFMFVKDHQHIYDVMLTEREHIDIYYEDMFVDGGLNSLEDYLSLDLDVASTPYKKQLDKPLDTFIKNYEELLDFVSDLV